MIKKKLIIFVLSFALIFPAIQSKAFIFLGAPAVGLMSAGEVAGALVGLGLGGLIGQQLGWIDLPSLDPDKDDVRLPLTPLTRDRPVANPDAPTSAPLTNPDTVQSSYTCPPLHTSQGGSAGCSYYLDYIYTQNASNGAWCDLRQQYRPNDTSGCPGGYNYSADFLMHAQASMTCPSGYSGTSTCIRNAETSACGTGYTLVNGACSLTNPQAIPDGKADLEVFSPAPGVVSYRPIADDPDQNDGLTLEQGAALFQILHPDYVDGYPPGYWDDRNDAPAVHVAIDPSGGASGMCPYQTCIPIPGLPGHFRISALSNTATGAQAVVVDVNSSTGVVDQAVTVPLAGQILSAGQTYTNSAGAVVTVQSGQVVLANAAGGTYVQTTQAAAPSASINIPTDYARTGEATTSAKSITDKLAETPDSTDDLGQPALENPLSSYFNPLRAWSVPVQAGTCPNGSFAWNGNTFTFDVMCQLFNENLSIIQAAMNTVYVLAALFIVLGA